MFCRVYDSNVTVHFVHSNVAKIHSRFVQVLNHVMSAGVNVIIDHGLTPFASIFIEPAKVLFLNNAINHGILGPLGITQAAEAGKSILFILEPNPGPGVGVLLAYTFFGTGTAKKTAPGVAIIQDRKSVV